MVGKYKVFKLNVWLLKAIGVWHRYSTSRLTATFQATALATIVCIFIGMHLCLLVDALLHRSDIAYVIEDLSMVLAASITLSKLANLALHIDDIKILLDKLEEDYDADDDIQVTNMKFGGTLTKIFFGSLLFTGTSYSYIPLVEYYTSHLMCSSENVTTAERPLPYHIWMPFDTKVSPYYEITYFWISLQTGLGGFTVPAHDMTLIVLVLMISSQIKSLHKRIVNLSSKETLNWKGSIIRRSNNPTQSVESIDEDFKLIVIRHQEIIEMVNRLDKAFSHSMLSQFLCSLFIICLAGIQARLTPVGSVKIVNRFALLISAILQLSLLCWFGEQIKQDSLQLSEGAYESHWYTLPPSVGRGLQLLMLRSQRPLLLSAGSFTTATLHSLASVMQLSYSYFTVLLQVVDSQSVDEISA